MALRYVSGDLLNASAHALVVPVNCQGIAGRGLALQCKRRYPDWFWQYQGVCRMGRLSIGTLFDYSDEDGLYIIGFPTKERWWSPTRYEHIEQGLDALVGWVASRSEWVQSVAVPKLGCGPGGLSWQQVQPLMERYLGSLSWCDVCVYV